MFQKILTHVNPSPSLLIQDKFCATQSIRSQLCLFGAKMNSDKHKMGNLHFSDSVLASLIWYGRIHYISIKTRDIVDKYVPTPFYFLLCQKPFSMSVNNFHTGRSRGREGRNPPGQNFFIFVQFSGKIGQIVCWRSPPGLVRPLGNPGSATVSNLEMAFL